MQPKFQLLKSMMQCVVGGSKHFACFYDILERKLISSSLNNGLATAVLSVAIHVHVCTGFLLTCNACMQLVLCVRVSVVVETFPRPFRDLSTCLSLEIVRYINISTTEAIESNDLNIENW